MFISQSNVDILILSSIFHSNSGHSGAGLYTSEFNTNLTVSDSSFENNIAKNDGGGIYISILNDDVEVMRSNFLNNKAIDGDGGGLLVLSSLKFLNSNCEGNKAQSGGCLSLSDSSEHL